MVDTNDPILRRIKESIADKSPRQIATMRAEIAEHIRGLEPHMGANELLTRFGQERAEQEVQRLERHRAELAYLDALLKPGPQLRVVA